MLKSEKSTFMLLSHHLKPAWLGKNYFQSDLRFWDCLLTGWLWTTSILVVMETIYCYQLKHNYLKTKHFSWNFYCIFRIYIKFRIFWNKMSFITSVFLKLWLWKTCLLKCIKGLVCENPLVVNVLMSLINWWNLKKVLLSYFLIILSQLELEKYIFNEIWDFRTGC